MFSAPCPYRAVVVFREREPGSRFPLEIVEPDVCLSLPNGQGEPFAVGRNSRTKIARRCGDERLGLSALVDPKNRIIGRWAVQAVPREGIPNNA